MSAKESAMPNEMSVEEIVAAFEKGFVNGGWRDLCYLPYMRALIADWRKRGKAMDAAGVLALKLRLLEKELDALSASHKDLSSRVARMGEALRDIDKWHDWSIASRVLAAIAEMERGQ